MLNTGDLVVPTNGYCFLEHDLKEIRGKRFHFSQSEVGTVLEVGEGNMFNSRMVRILTQRGVGWCLHDWLERVNESG